VRTKAETMVTGKQEAKGAKVNHKITKARKAAAAATAEDSPAVTIDTRLTLKIARKIDPDDEAEADEDGPIQLIPAGAKAESQRELVKMAFAGDDVVREFRKEKKQVAEDDDDKIIDQTLPGWGSWAGSGLTKKQRNQNKRRKAVTMTVKGISKDKRKDAKLGNVIISEKRDKKVRLALWFVSTMSLTCVSL
jgi:U3 small nucleolar RNA-associated protein 14